MLLRTGIRNRHCTTETNGWLGHAASFIDQSSVTVHLLPFLTRARETPSRVGFAGARTGCAAALLSRQDLLPCRPRPSAVATCAAPPWRSSGLQRGGRGRWRLQREGRDGSRVTSSWRSAARDERDNWLGLCLLIHAGSGQLLLI